MLVELSSRTLFNVADLAVGPAVWVLCPYLFVLVCCPISTALLHESILLLRRLGSGDLPVSRGFHLDCHRHLSKSWQVHEGSAARMRGGRKQEGKAGRAPPSPSFYLQVPWSPQSQSRRAVHRVYPPGCVSEGRDVRLARLSYLCEYCLSGFWCCVRSWLQASTFTSHQLPKGSCRVCSSAMSIVM